MAANTVTFEGERVHAADDATGWTAWGGGKAPGTETDFVYQGSLSISLKVTTTQQGPAHTANAGVDFTTPKVAIFKGIVTTPGIINDAQPGAGGYNLIIGSTSANYEEHYIHGNATYPITGGWIVTPIDPNIVNFTGANTGTPTLSSITYYAVTATMSGSSKVENVAADAIDYVTAGDGLELTRGDGANDDATFQNLVDFDEGTSANRYGIIQTREGIIYVNGTIKIGNSSVSTEFTDSSQTLVWPDGIFDTDYAGMKIDCTDTATTVSITDCTFIGRGSPPGNSETRPSLTVSGNTAGTTTLDGCVFTNWNVSTLSGNTTATGSSWVNCQRLNQANASIISCTMDSSPVTTNNAFLISDNLNTISGTTFNSGGSGHAIEITKPGTYTFDGNSFNSYGSTGTGDAAIFNNSGGAVTIDLLNSATPTFINGTSATTTINNNVKIDVNVLDSGASPISGANVAVFIASSDTNVLLSSTNVNGNANTTYNYSADENVYIRVRSSTTSVSPRYTPTSTVGTITENGLNVTVTLFEDGIVAA
jgi:hypothetical protein